MLDYANQLRREQKMTLKQALIEGSPTKLKPIIMSTVAIILGLLPMAIGIGDAGKEIRVPLGVVSVGGLISSTILTLYFIPAFYILTHIVFEKSGKMVSPIIKKFKKAEVPDAIISNN
jgi:HAE1 family hydrophobic/amphiphilic exporter-1